MVHSFARKSVFVEDNRIVASSKQPVKETGEQILAMLKLEYDLERLSCKEEFLFVDKCMMAAVAAVLVFLFAFVVYEDIVEYVAVVLILEVRNREFLAVIAAVELVALVVLEELLVEPLL